MRINMKHFLPVTSICVGLLGIILPTAKADESNQKTIVTFREPVEIPGQVLPAGTYVFKLADSDTDRDIVQVYNKEKNHFYGTFLTIPDYRLQPAGKPIISFDERPSGDPEALKAWFYPGEIYGHDFVYPKSRAVALASTNKQPVPSMPTELTTNTTTPTQSVKEPHVVAMIQAPLKAEKPTGAEVEVAEVFAVAQPPAPTPKSLPETATTAPLIGLLGLLSLAIAVCLPKLAPAKNLSIE
jgi:hypothetical protein